MTFKPSTTQHHKCLLTRKSFWTNINPFEQKNENENIIQVLLEVGVIRSNTSPYSSRPNGHGFKGTRKFIQIYWFLCPQ